jgi:hypothetical protein
MSACINDPSDGAARLALPVRREHSRAALQRSSWLMRWLGEAPSRWLGQAQHRRARSGRRRRWPGVLARPGPRQPGHAAGVLREASTPGRRRCLLIHGFLGTRGSMYLLEKRLRDDGFMVISFNIGAVNTRDIRRSAFLIRTEDRARAGRLAVAEDRRDRPLDGRANRPVLRQEARRRGADPQAHHDGHADAAAPGSRWPASRRLGLWSTSSWQLLPRSRFLDELAAGPMPPEVEVYTLAAARDWVVPLARTQGAGLDAGHRAPGPLEPGGVRGRLPAGSSSILRPSRGDAARRRATADAP